MTVEAQIKKLDYTKTAGEGGKQTALMNIYCRTADGERIHVTNNEHQSYFYVPTEEVDDHLKTHDRVKDLEDGYTSIKDRELTRVYTYIPGDVPKVREKYTHYEADILYPSRFSLDTGIYGGVELPDYVLHDDTTEVSLSEIETIEYTTQTRIAFCDIEVDDEDGFPDEDKAAEEVVCITIYDNFVQTYRVYVYDEDNRNVSPESKYADDIHVQTFDNEIGMLSTFAADLNELAPDVIAGWNLKKFDAMYLISRFDRLDELHTSELSPLGSAYNDGWYGGKIKGMSVFDMLKAYKNLQFTELDSFSLEDVAQEELNIGKLNTENTSIHEMWESDLDSLLEYNIRDVYLTVELERTQDIITFYEQVAGVVGGRLAEVVDYSKAADIYVLRMVNGKFAVPSMDTVSSGDDDEFEGAAVFDPVSEIKEMISVLDLASLYPYSMKTLNAGPRTKDADGQITAPNGISFSTQNKSIISDIIDNLLDEREKKKEQRAVHSPGTREYIKYDLQQRAIKVIANTLYGVLAWSRFRLYDQDVAAAVTATGREVIKFTEEKVNKMGYEVVYGDTDSIMVEFDDADDIDEVIYRSFRMEELINNSYDEFAKQELNVDEHFFDIEFEKVYRRYIQAGKKKRYAGHIVWKDGKETDSIDIVGLEFQRSDYSTAAKKLQEMVVESILMGAEKNEIRELVTREIEKIKNLEYSLDELGIPGGIGRAFEEYTNKTKHVRAAEYANEHLGEQIQPGDKPKGIYVERVPEYPSPPSLQESKFICWMNSSNVPDATIYDWNKYLNIQVDNPLSTIFECTQWGWDEIKSGQDQSNINTFGNGDGDDLATFETSTDLSTTSTQHNRTTVETIDHAERNTNKTNDKHTIPETGTVEEFEDANDAMAVFETTGDLETDDDIDVVEDDEVEEIEIIEFDDVESENNDDNKQTQSDLQDF